MDKKSENGAIVIEATLSLTVIAICGMNSFCSDYCVAHSTIHGSIRLVAFVSVFCEIKAY